MALVEHKGKVIRALSRHSMIGEIAPLTLNFFGGSVQVCLYHTYENYFRVYLEDTSNEEDLEAEEQTERAYAIIDLHLSQLDTLKHFITLPIKRKDHAFITAINTLRSSQNQSSNDSMLSDIVKHVYCSNQDIYQTWRYMPSDTFLIGCEDADTKSDLQKNFQPAMPEFMCRVLGNLMRTTQSMKCKGLSCLMASMAHFVRCWDNLRSLAMFVIKDEPEEKRFWVICNLESLDHLNQEKHDQPTLEYTQKYSIRYSYMCKAFGVDLLSLDWEEKLVIFKMFVDNVEIGSPIKPAGVQLSPSKKTFDKSQYLTIQPPAILSEWTMGEVSEVPDMTFSMRLLSVDGTPAGVTVAVDKFHDEKDVPLCMLVVHPRKIE